MFTSSKTDYLDTSGAVLRTEAEQSSIEISKSQVTITPGNANRKMVGTIQSTTCDWSKAYQDGKRL